MWIYRRDNNRRPSAFTERTEDDGSAFAPARSTWFLISNWGRMIFLIFVIVAGAIGLSCFAAHVSMRNQTAAEADESDWGLVVRVEILRVWLPPVLSELAKQDPPTAVIRTHEELRRHLELCGQENTWYAMIWRGHNAQREFVDIPVVRQPYGEAHLFPELLELLSSAAGNSHGEPTGLYATTSFGLLPESFLKREPRAAVADLLDVSPPPLNAERIR
jgi:hypothetical protein